MYYAVTTGRTPPDKSSYTTFIPRATSAGTYYVWYKVVGDANYKDTEKEPKKFSENTASRARRLSAMGKH